MLRRISRKPAIYNDIKESFVSENMRKWKLLIFMIIAKINIPILTLSLSMIKEGEVNGEIIRMIINGFLYV